MGQMADDFYLLNTHTNDTETATHIMQFIYLSFGGFRFPIAYPTAKDNEPEIYKWYGML